MSKIEAKVAWLKSSSWNRVLLTSLRRGDNISHTEMLAAVGDDDNLKVFDPQQSQRLDKSDFVIFQYGVYLQRRDGRVAVFERAKQEQGQERVTSGFSVLLSHSSPDSPDHAIPRLIRNQILVGKRAKIQSLSSCGLLWNAIPPRTDKPSPTYLFAIYRHEMEDDNPLHGRFKDSPDHFVDWVPADRLPERMSRSGYVDQVLAKQIRQGGFEVVDEGDNGVVFSPSSRLSADGSAADQFESIEYLYGHNVFISHTSEDSFSAFALYRFLIDESSRTILATLDLTHVRGGDSLSKLERMINDCDGVVLVITPTLLAKSQAHLEKGTNDWVRWEIELAQSLGKPILGFKLGTTGRPPYLQEDLVVHDKALYPDWLAEIRMLVKDVQARFGG